jgi:hypothetical protein
MCRESAGDWATSSNPTNSSVGGLKTTVQVTTTARSLHRETAVTDGRCQSRIRNERRLPRSQPRDDTKTCGRLNGDAFAGERYTNGWLLSKDDQRKVQPDIAFSFKLVNGAYVERNDTLILQDTVPFRVSLPR